MTDREVNGVTVIDLEGRIVLGEESNSFRERVKSLLAAGKKKIVLNLANVSYIDSAGLGTLVATFHSALAGRYAEARQPWAEIQGSAAGDEADDRFRHLRKRTSSHPELRKIT